jgi:hypothetical protein
MGNQFLLHIVGRGEWYSNKMHVPSTPRTPLPGQKIAKLSDKYRLMTA